MFPPKNACLATFYYCHTSPISSCKISTSSTVPLGSSNPCRSCLVEKDGLLLVMSQV